MGIDRVELRRRNLIASAAMPYKTPNGPIYDSGDFATLLDRALFRRFDDVLRYPVPDAPARRRLIANVLGKFMGRQPNWKKLLSASGGLSHAEIDHACRDAIKEAILQDRKSVSSEALAKALRERRQTHQR